MKGESLHCKGVRWRCLRYGAFIALVILSLSRCGGSDAAGPTGPTGPTASAPSVTTSSLPDGTVGQSYSQAVAATGGDGSYSWTVSSGALPAGLSLSGAGTISGTPTTAETASFTVQVTSAGLSGTADLSITIAAAILAPTVTTSSLPGGTVGVAYSQAVAATGGDGSYSWTVSSGALPAGLSLSGAGTISGTPSAAGTATFTVQVTSAGLTGTASLSITIGAANSAPSVTTSSLPDGTVGQSYSQRYGAFITLAATGGDGSYSWSISSGALPAGLSLSGAGTISGTPSAAGTATFTVQVTSAGLTGTASLSITIAAAPVTTVVIVGKLRVKVGDAYVYTAIASLSDGTVVSRSVTWSVSDPAQGTMTSGGILTPLQTGTITLVATIDGVNWIGTTTAYDWSVLNSASNMFVSLYSDNTITNRFGSPEFPQLVISCNLVSGTFFVWVSTDRFVTKNGLVTYSFDGAPASAADSDEVNTLVRGMWVTRSEGSGPPDPGMWSGVVGAKRRWSDQVVDSGACLLMEAPLSWMRWA